MTTTLIEKNQIEKIQQDLNHNGFSICHFKLNDEISQFVARQDYIKLDQEFFKLTACNGEIFNFLKNFCDVKSMEFIISLRESKNDWEEDGIWHDDGSRILAFSLSLTQASPSGGILEIRKKGNENSFKIPTPNYGQMIIFKTGVDGYEHKINRVTEGARLIIAGWCS